MHMIISPDSQTQTGHNHRKRRVLLGMSGGVDSSVACFLLKEQGYDVVGLTLLTNPRSDEHLDDVKAICRQAGIKLIVADVRQSFKTLIIDDFIRSYAQGHTPNPCVLCNPAIKFSVFIEAADANDCDFVATGHYAAIQKHPETGRLTLTRTDAGLKDQTYFMYRLTQEQLSRVIFPLSGWQKKTIRQKAASLGLIGHQGSDLASKPDSQDNCFVPEAGYAEFIRTELEKNGPHEWLNLLEPGPVKNTQGETIGTHRGLIHYTIGQRKGFQVKTTDRLFVLGKDPGRNALIVGQHHQVMRQKILVTDPVYSGLDAIKTGQQLQAKIRNSANPKPCRVYPVHNMTDETPDGLFSGSEAANNSSAIDHASDKKQSLEETSSDAALKTASDKTASAAVKAGKASNDEGSPAALLVVFDESVPAPAPGQSCVFYDGDYIMAGGFISDRYL